VEKEGEVRVDVSKEEADEFSDDLGRWDVRRFSVSCG
jgi:hypothetical protein